MPLDTNIALRAAQGTAAANPAAALNQGLATANSLAKLQQYGEQRRREGEVRNIFAEYGDDTAGLVAALRTGGHVDTANRVEKHAADMAQHDAGMTTFKLKQNLGNLQVANRVAKAAVDIYRNTAKGATSGVAQMDAQRAMVDYVRQHAEDLIPLMGSAEAVDEVLANGFTVDEADELFRTTEQGVLAARTRLDAFTGGGKPPAPQTDLGKLTTDYRNGLLGSTPAENERAYQEQLSKANLKGLEPKDLAQLAEQQGDNYVKASQNYEAVRDAYGRIQASANGTPAGDLSLIFNYMKMLDPNSVVRESEFAAAAASGSYGDRIQGLVQQITTGKRLADPIRQDFVQQSRKLMQTAQRTQDLTRTNYVKIAERSGLNADDITDRVSMLDMQAREQAAGGDPQPQPGGGGGPQGVAESREAAQPGQQYRAPDGSIRRRGQ